MIENEKSTDTIKLIPVYADKNDTHFSCIFIFVSLLALQLMYLIGYSYLPPITKSEIGIDNCPENTLNFKDFCHKINLNQTNQWRSNIHNVSRANGAIFAGATVLLPEKLRQNSHLKSNRV